MFLQLGWIIIFGITFITLKRLFSFMNLIHMPIQMSFVTKHWTIDFEFKWLYPLMNDAKVPFKVLIAPNSLLQILQGWNKSFFLCMLSLWVPNESLVEKGLLQISHSNDFFPSWTEEICSLKLLISTIEVLQVKHLNLFFLHVFYLYVFSMIHFV